MRPAETGPDSGAIGQVHVYIYRLESGGCQVQLQLPADALPGSPHAGVLRAQILELLQSELATAMELTGLEG